MTLAGWERGLAEDEAVHWQFLAGVLVVFEFEESGYSKASALKRYRARIVARLWVELFENVLARNLLMEGRFASDIEYLPRSVSPALMLNPDIWFDPVENGLYPNETDKGPTIRDLIVYARLNPHAPGMANPASPGPDPMKHREIYRSGAQGRPTSMHLIVVELDRRRDAEETLSTQMAEAAALADWLKHKHPRAAPATAKTIRNRSNQDCEKRWSKRKPKKLPK